MSRTTKAAPAALAVGIALGGMALGVISAKRKQGQSTDDGPGFAARNKQGDYHLTGRSVTIRKPREELFRFWRDFANLTRFMENLERIDIEDGNSGKAVWHIKAPAGRTVAVKTRIEDEEQGKHIAWRSIDGSEIETKGKVTFEDAPGDRGTRVGLTIAYNPPMGSLGKAVAKAFLREPAIQARHDLKRFKMLMETGEISTSARTKSQTRAAQQEKAA